MATITAPVRSTSTEPTGVAAWSVWTVGAVFGLAAVVAATATAALAMAIGVPMEAAPASEPAGQPLPLAGFVTTSLFGVAIGTVLAVALTRWSKRPAVLFLVVTIALTLASFALPHTTHYATAATRLTLDLTHVTAALAFIPAMAWRLARIPGRG